MAGEMLSQSLLLLSRDRPGWGLVRQPGQPGQGLLAEPGSWAKKQPLGTVFYHLEMKIGREMASRRRLLTF